MTAVSTTITVTNTEYETLESLINTTLTNGTSYTIQAQNYALKKAMQIEPELYLLIGDAEFTLINQNLAFTKGSDSPYVKVENLPVVLTILENS